MPNTPGPSSRFQLVVPPGVLEQVKELASAERRSISNMIVVLLEEAIKSRKAKKAEKEGNSLPVLIAA